MTDIKQNRGVVFFLMGALLVVALVLLTGASSLQQIGRYRMSVTTRDRFTDIYVIDTATGIVKYVGKDEGKPFDAIRGK